MNGTKKLKKIMYSKNYIFADYRISNTAGTCTIRWNSWEILYGVRKFNAVK